MLASWLTLARLGVRLNLGVRLRLGLEEGLTKMVKVRGRVR